MGSIWKEDNEADTRERRERRKVIRSWVRLSVLAFAALSVAFMALTR